ncbi:hypothetical protein NDU88_002348 [Pleurodeles waltl]|uniref:Uncharacterized protein n=1 Tax=Pleurodeles waltl TaxID=8319 RepID=A0AAV7TMC2_PLEWA|nr:hypothetical protein NDU88_002348 [Pleurodeles waltl]
MVRAQEHCCRVNLDLGKWSSLQRPVVDPGGGHPNFTTGRAPCFKGLASTDKEGADGVALVYLLIWGPVDGMPGPYLMSTLGHFGSRTELGYQKVEPEPVPWAGSPEPGTDVLHQMEATSDTHLGQFEKILQATLDTKGMLESKIVAVSPGVGLLLTYHGKLVEWVNDMEPAITLVHLTVQELQSHVRAMQVNNATLQWRAEEAEAEHNRTASTFGLPGACRGARVELFLEQWLESTGFVGHPR